MIALGTSSKPFPRAAKGTVVRHLVAATYSSEIAKLYDAVEAVNISAAPDNQGYYPSDIIKLIRSTLLEVLPTNAIQEDDNLFTRGLDSVKTLEMISFLKSRFDNSESEEACRNILTPRIVYKHYSIQSLATAISEATSPESRIDGAISAPSAVSTINMEIDLLIHSYTHNLPSRQPQLREISSAARINVALTGTTGSLGRYLLQRL